MSEENNKYNIQMRMLHLYSMSEINIQKEILKHINLSSDIIPYLFRLCNKNENLVEISKLLQNIDLD